MYNFDINLEKRKALDTLLKKYVPICVTLGVVFLLNVIAMILAFKGYILEDTSYVFAAYFTIGFWFLYYFLRDYKNFICLQKDKYRIVEDVVDYSKRVEFETSNQDNFKLKRKKIAFENTYLNFYDYKYSELKAGDKVYLWMSDDGGYDRILHVTKKN